MREMHRIRLITAYDGLPENHLITLSKEVAQEWIDKGIAVSDQIITHEKALRQIDRQPCNCNKR